MCTLSRRPNARALTRSASSSVVTTRSAPTRYAVRVRPRISSAGLTRRATSGRALRATSAAYRSGSRTAPATSTDLATRAVTTRASTGRWLSGR
ncbi:hypothetical protein BJF81_06355 [Ornithinimicrobium sp. CNJ-824]|nr:hypothetical protein BJF81_06355 [Ornithinimicrobium sp. CNJ-824]